MHIQDGHAVQRSLRVVGRDGRCAQHLVYVSLQLVLQRPRVFEDFIAAGLGSLVALFERAVGFYASLVGINAYHQPGVEAGKKAAAEVLDLQRRTVTLLEKWRGEGRTAEEIASELGEEDQAETVYLLLRHLVANRRHGIHAIWAERPDGVRFLMEA